MAATRAAHQAAGSCSLRGGDGGRMAGRSGADHLPGGRGRAAPTLVDWVDESTPATSGMVRSYRRPVTACRGAAPGAG